MSGVLLTFCFGVGCVCAAVGIDRRQQEQFTLAKIADFGVAKVGLNIAEHTCDVPLAHFRTEYLCGYLYSQCHLWSLPILDVPSYFGCTFLFWMHLPILDAPSCILDAPSYFGCTLFPYQFDTPVLMSDVRLTV
jgi:hypothetical protein